MVLLKKYAQGAIAFTQAKTYPVIKIELIQQSIFHKLYNASGLAFHPQSGDCYMIINDPEQIVHLKNNRIHKSYTLKNFEDTEALTWIHSNVFAIAEERRNTISLIRLDKDIIDRDTDVIHQIKLTMDVQKNKGIEGLTYDRHNDRLVCVTEQSPISLYEIPLKNNKLSAAQEIFSEIDFENDIKDASGIALIDGQLALLSDESKTINFLAADGSKSMQIVLDDFHNGLAEEILQPEGIAFNPQTQELYICSEPGTFYILNYKKKYQLKEVY